MVYLKTGNTSKFTVLLVSYCLILIILIVPASAIAAMQWSLSVVEGYYYPKLTELNYVLNHYEVELGPRNTEAKPFPYPVIYQGISPEMPDMRPSAPKTGFQVQADINPSYAVVFGGTSATYDSTKRDIRLFFVGFSILADRETRFSLSLNQFWFGLKRYFTWEEKEEKKEDERDKESQPEGKKEEGEKESRPSSRFYVEMGMLAITRAYLTTDVWLHVFDPESGFDFYKVTETGISGNGFATYLGMGGEYYLKEWLSVGLNIDYLMGGVGKMKFTNYFTVDPLEKDIIKPGDSVMYTDLLRGGRIPLFLNLEGWDLKGQVRVYF